MTSNTAEQEQPVARKPAAVPAAPPQPAIDWQTWAELRLRARHHHAPKDDDDSDKFIDTPDRHSAITTASGSIDVGLSGLIDPNSNPASAGIATSAGPGAGLGLGLSLGLSGPSGPSDPDHANQASPGIPSGFGPGTSDPAELGAFQHLADASAAPLAAAPPSSATASGAPFALDDFLHPSQTMLLVAGPVAGGAVLAVAANNSSSDSSGTAQATSTTAHTLAVTVMSGPLTAAVEVQAFDAKGNVVASGTSDATGHLQLAFADGVTGPLLLKATGVSGAPISYTDEATGQVETYAGSLRAMLVVSGDGPVTISPLSELAVQKMALTGDNAAVSADTVNGTLVRLGNAYLTTATAWSFTTPLLTAGAHSISARVENAATGGNGSMSQAFAVVEQTVAITSVVDHTGPTTGSIGSGSGTDDTLPTINGTLGTALLPTEQLAIYDGTQQLGVVTAFTGLNWSYTPTTILADGNHNIRAIVQLATDSTITTGHAISNLASFVVDTPAPTQHTTIANGTDTTAKDGTWTDIGTTTNSGHIYEIYNSPGAQLLIETSLTRTVI